MKLVDFTEHEGFNRLRAAMQAERVVWKAPFAELTKEQAIRLRNGVSFEDISKIPRDTAGLYQVDGRRVVVYIRDQVSNDAKKGVSNYKYHLCDCGTLKTMHRSGRYKRRYVVSNRDDGFFRVNRVKYGQVESRDEKVKMELCRNCWHDLQSLGHGIYFGNDYNKFNLKEYFENVGTSLIEELPAHTDITSPLNEYSPRQRELSIIIRKNRNWKCEKCGIDFSKEKVRKFLHVHHRDGQKSNNSSDNLEVLCVRCHAERPQHAHLRNTPSFGECLKYIEENE